MRTPSVAALALAYALTVAALLMRGRRVSRALHALGAFAAL